MKNHKNIGFLSNTGPDPLINHKAAFYDGVSLAGRMADDGPKLFVFGSTHQQLKTVKGGPL